MDNLIMILVIIIGIAAAGLFVVWFYKQERARQIELVKQWLLLIVVQAEKELGSNTGQIKLRFVYDKFLERFKFLSRIITFEQFSGLVDESLDTMRKMVESNQSLIDYINK